jgi:hypothetical protein
VTDFARHLFTSRNGNREEKLEIWPMLDGQVDFQGAGKGFLEYHSVIHYESKIVFFASIILTSALTGLRRMAWFASQQSISDSY